MSHSSATSHAKTLAEALGAPECLSEREIQASFDEVLHAELAKMPVFRKDPAAPSSSSKNGAIKDERKD